MHFSDLVQVFLVDVARASDDVFESSHDALHGGVVAAVAVALAVVVDHGGDGQHGLLLQLLVLQQRLHLLQHVGGGLLDQGH